MDVAVIGGGPAGSLAAARLAGGGLKVTLFHDDARPEKPCGGGIPWRGIEHAPFLLDSRLPRKEIRRMLLVAPSGESAELDLDRPLCIFSRAQLDRFMRDHAVSIGARLVPLHVSRIARDGGGFLLTTSSGETFRAARIVGADGASSLVRRTFLGVRRQRVLSQSVGWYVRGVTDERVVCRFEAGLPGYQWSFPRTDHLAVGICAPLGQLKLPELRRRCLDFVRTLVPQEEPLPDDDGRRVYYSALIPAPERGPDGRMVVQGDGWALLGDAAGAVDPITREGIHYALESASLYADSLLDPGSGSYARRFARRFPAELTWAASRAARFFDPALTERVVRYAAASASIRGLFRDLVAGRQPYTTLKRRLLGCAVPLMVSLAVRRLSAAGARAS